MVRAEGMRAEGILTFVRAWGNEGRGHDFFMRAEGMRAEGILTFVRAWGQRALFLPSWGQRAWGQRAF
jgi:hypothetical protein